MRLLLLCLSFLLASVNGLYEQFFQFDLEGLMKDETRMKALFDCLMGRGSCENFQIIKDTAPLLFYNKCEGCTAEQKEIFDKTILNLAQKYPKEYAELTQPSPLPILRGPGGGLDKKTAQLFEVDFTRLLTDKKHSKELVNCLVDRGPCDDYKFIKATLPKVYFNKCKGCTTEQKEVFDWTIDLITKLYPEEMAAFAKSLEENPPGLTASQEDLLNQDFTNLLGNKNELRALVDCLMDRGPCEKYMEFKTAGAKLLQTACKACTLKQKEKFVSVIKQFAKNYPKGYAEIVYKLNIPDIGEFDELFKINFNKIMADDKKLETVFKCVMDKGPCDGYQTIKDLLPRLLTTKCEKCKPEQITVYKDILAKFTKNYPKEYEELTKKLSQG